MELTEAEKETLLGKKVRFIAYDPTTVIGDPEGEAALYTEEFRSTTANLVEIILSE